MAQRSVMLISGTSRGIGRHLAEYYAARHYEVIGCSRSAVHHFSRHYRHFRLDIADEPAVKKMFTEIRKTHGGLDVLINNAAVATMNHSLLTPVSTARRILDTNVVGTFLLCREGARLMRKRSHGRIVNFTTVAAALKLEGESIYAASKAAVATYTQILARELGETGITVNAIGPTAIATDMSRKVPQKIIKKLEQRQAIHRSGTFEDIVNVTDFFIRRESGFVTGQVLYLGGV